MQSADNTGAMARNDEEGNCAASVFDIAEIVEAEDIVGCTGSFISISHANKEGIKVEGEIRDSFTRSNVFHWA
jgi:hypothetical protein